MAGEMTKKKGFIEVNRGKKKPLEQIEILYYPTDYTVEKNNTFSEISVPGLEAPYLQFVKGNASTITLEVFYDTYEAHTDVREYSNKLSKLMEIEPDLHAPPTLRFIWGMYSQESFYCVLERVSKKFTMFNKDGIPVRARLNITLKEIKLELNERERNLQSPDMTHSCITMRGDSLWSIAYREYGNPGLWRYIADANSISDPKRLEPGKELVIPPLE
jgi:hypothetical protein